GRRLRIPREQRLDVGAAHRSIVFAAQQVLEEDLERERQAIDGRAIFGDAVQAVDLVAARADVERTQGAEAIEHGGLSSNRHLYKEKSCAVQRDFCAASTVARN